MRRTLLIFCALVYPLFIFGQKSVTISSPDRSLLVQWATLEDGRLFYTVNYKGKEIITPSSLGFSLQRPEVDLNRFEIVQVETSSHDGKWKPVWGEVAEIRDHYNESRVLLREAGGTGIMVALVFRVYNDGLGFRYEFPEQSNLKHFIVKEEQTQFAIASDNKTFWIPGDFDTNEYLYNTTKLSEIDALAAAEKEKDIAVQSLISANAVQTPLMMKSPDNIYVNIHEAGLANYATMHLLLDKPTLTFTTCLTPDAVGNKGYLQRRPGRSLGCQPDSLPD